MVTRYVVTVSAFGVPSARAREFERDLRALASVPVPSPIETQKLSDRDKRRSGHAASRKWVDKCRGHLSHSTETPKPREKSYVAQAAKNVLNICFPVRGRGRAPEMFYPRRLSAQRSVPSLRRASFATLGAGFLRCARARSCAEGSGVDSTPKAMTRSVVARDHQPNSRIRKRSSCRLWARLGRSAPRILRPSRLCSNRARNPALPSAAA